MEGKLTFELEGFIAKKLVHVFEHQATDAGLRFRATKIGGWIMKHYMITVTGETKVLKRFGKHVKEVIRMNQQGE